MSVETGRLYLHLGPPKTGTTSLQIAAQEADLPWLMYGGTSQPRSLDPDSLAYRLHAIARGDVAADSDEGQLTRNQIEEVLSSGRHLFVSEEMFLVTQRGVTFQDKLSHLADFLAGVPVSVLLTLRDPAKALPSYYQEIYHALPLSERLSFSAFCRGDRAQCFDYAALLRQLRDRGFKDILLLTFDEIASGFVSYVTLFGLNFESDIGFTLGVHNAGTRDRRTGARELPSLSLRVLLACSWLTHLVRSDHVRGTRAYRWLSARLGGIKLIPSRKRRLEVPRDLQERLSAEFARLVAIASSTVGVDQQSESTWVPTGTHSVLE